MLHIKYMYNVKKMDKSQSPAGYHERPDHKIVVFIYRAGTLNAYIK